MNKKTHDYLYPLVVKKQGGEYCMKCVKDPFILNELGRSPELCIDHIDNNNNNNVLSNLQLLCHSCNTSKNHPAHEPNKRNVTPEMGRGDKNRATARIYVYGRLQDPVENFALHYDTLIDDLAEYMECSQQAVKNYIASMCSKKHGLLTFENRNGEIYVVPKNDEELDLVVNQQNIKPQKERV